MRLIDADALLEVVQYRITADDLAGMVIQRCVEITREKIQQMPTIDAEPVKYGRWIDNVDENGIRNNAWRKCSVCGGLNFSKRPPYCPNCGARMDGE